MNGGECRLRRRRLLAAGILFATGTAKALDNPDAPDFVGEFLARARPYEERLGEESGGGGVAPAAMAYEVFLDAELNRAYSAVLTHLDHSVRRTFVDSQRLWLRWRDAEHRFIAGNWTMASSGSSYTLTRAQYRSQLTKERVLALLNYLRTYPDPPR